MLAFTAAVGLTLGTVGFASMDVDRGIEVGVVDDESAYLVANPNDTLVVNASSTAVVYENGFDTELDDFSVHVTSTSVNVTAEAPDRLDVGESKPVNVTVETESPPEEPIELQLDVTASGDGVNVEMSRAYEFHLVSDVDD
ncbi:MAG: hypothetical protein PPP55_01515 [Halorubrum sp.]